MGFVEGRRFQEPQKDVSTKRRSVLYLNYSSVLTQGLLRSQAAHLCEQLAREGEFDFTLVTAERCEDLRARRDELSELRAELKQAGVRLVVVPKLLPRYLTVLPQGLRRTTHLVPFALDLFVFFVVAGWLIVRRRVRVIHARSYVAALVGCFFRKLIGVRLIFDPRGALPEEMAAVRGWADDDWRLRWWKKRERKILRQATAVIVVSTPFREHFRAIAPEAKYFVIPGCVDLDLFKFDADARARLRWDMRLNQRFVAVFSMGSYAPYQNFEQIFPVMREIRKLRGDALLLVLTPDIEAVGGLLRTNGFRDDDFRIRAAKFNEMPGYLSVADVALLVRERSVGSRVASPVKFPEYLACGLSVIATGGVGDTETALRKWRVGVVVNPDEPVSLAASLTKLLDEAARDESKIRRAARAAAKDFYCCRKFMSVYRSLYG